MCFVYHHCVYMLCDDIIFDKTTNVVISMSIRCRWLAGAWKSQRFFTLMILTKISAPFSYPPRMRASSKTYLCQVLFHQHSQNCKERRNSQRESTSGKIFLYWSQEISIWSFQSNGLHIELLILFAHHTSITNGISSILNWHQCPN